MKGSYALIIHLGRDRLIEVGALGQISFAAGAYAYVGSALSGLEARIERHRRDDKRLHWHVDYLLQHATVADVVRVVSNRRVECRIAAALAERLDAVSGFGCSDCGCDSHLFFAENLGDLRNAVAGAVEGVS